VVPFSCPASLFAGTSSAQLLSTSWSPHHQARRHNVRALQVDVGLVRGGAEVVDIRGGLPFRLPIRGVQVGPGGNALAILL
jgi:hypothetical protein